MTILSRLELDLVKPALAVAESIDNAYVRCTVMVPNARRVTVEASQGHIHVCLEPPDGPPVREHFQTVQGMALAYGVDVRKLTRG